MRILKLKGKSEKIVLKQIEKEYGQRAIVVNSQKEEVTGYFKWFKSPKTVVTIAIKEEDDEITTSLSKEENILKSSTDDAKSYELLMELKNELGMLHEELNELKKEPSSKAVQKVMINELHSSEMTEHKVITYLRGKLVNLGIKPEICEILLSRIKEEEGEEFIRALYSELENALITREADSLPQIIFFIGSTGVGKTTTLAKLTAKYVLEEQKKVVLFTSDTYRIAAVEQLKTYADILGVQIEIIYDESELPQYIEKWKHMDHILIDTAGRSHKNEEQVRELKGLMQSIENKQVFLVINASTATKDVSRIVKTYEKTEKDFDLIITKLDETDEIGNIVNIGFYAQKAIRYLTTGQNVPTDIEVFNKEKYMTELLGRLNDE